MHFCCLPNSKPKIIPPRLQLPPRTGTMLIGLNRDGAQQAGGGRPASEINRRCTQVGWRLCWPRITRKDIPNSRPQNGNCSKQEMAFQLRYGPKNIPFYQSFIAHLLKLLWFLSKLPELTPIIKQKVQLLGVVRRFKTLPAPLGGHGKLPQFAQKLKMPKIICMTVSSFGRNTTC